MLTPDLRLKSPKKVNIAAYSRTYEMRLESCSWEIYAWHSKGGTKDLWIWTGSYGQNCKEGLENASKCHSLTTSQEQCLQKANRLIQGRLFKARRSMGLVTCGGMPIPMSKSPLLNEASWRLSEAGASLCWASLLTWCRIMQRCYLLSKSRVAALVDS